MVPRTRTERFFETHFTIRISIGKIKRKNTITQKLKFAILTLVSSFKILSFDSEKILYKVIYNGAPSNFIIDVKSKGMSISKKEQLWVVK